jgi:hypothetical protein
VVVGRHEVVDRDTSTHQSRIIFGLKRSDDFGNTVGHSHDLSPRFLRPVVGMHRAASGDE